MSLQRIDVAPAKDNGSHIADALVALATKTSAKLEEVWDEVGYSPAEKKLQMDGLLDGFKTLCLEKEKEERGVKDQFLASIKETQGKIAAMAKVLGQLEDEDGKAIGSNLTEKLAHYEMEEEELRKTCGVRKGKFEKLSQEIVHMTQVLGDDTEENLTQWKDFELSLSDERLQEFVNKRAALNKAMEDRMRTIAELVHGIQILMSELKMTVSTELDNRVMGSLGHPSPSGAPTLQSTERTASSVGIGRVALEELMARHKKLLDERDYRKSKLERMGEEIMDLWQQLDVDKEVQMAFTASVDGMGTQTVEAGEKELTRLKKLKMDMMSSLIQQTRGRIRELWHEMGYSSSDRASFAPIEVGEDGFTDELLLQHKQEAARLEDKLGTMKHILEKIEEREALAQQRIDMETISKDPNRLMPKGGKEERRQQQQMLQLELEMENKVKKRLPLLTKQLRKTVPQWENSQDCAFFYKGERYLDVLERSEEQYITLKEQIKASKEARKKVEREKLVSASPGGQKLGIALARDTPRSVRKPAPSTGRKVPQGGRAGKTPSTPLRSQPTGRPNTHFGMSTPDHRVDSSSADSDMASDAGAITDVSNLAINDQLGGTEDAQAIKKRPSGAEKEDTENSSFGSPRGSFEGCDT
ncbi:unnamed protein product [Discosporangium mesarthrocarpum]